MNTFRSHQSEDSDTYQWDVSSGYHVAYNGSQSNPLEINRKRIRGGGNKYPQCSVSDWSISPPSFDDVNPKRLKRTHSVTRIENKPINDKFALLSPEVDEDNELSVHLIPVKYPSYVLESSFLNRDDSARLWDLISMFIERRIENRQGVGLPSLGVITLLSHKIQIGSDVYLHDMKPAFLVKGKFALLHRLRRTTVRTSSEIPTVQLNFSTLARLLAVERDRVEMAYCETLEKISSMLRSGRKVVLPFRGIGHLVFHLETVKMHFLPSFRKRFEKNVREKGSCQPGFRSFIP